MNVFELFATLGLDSSAYDEGLDSAETKGSSFGQKLGTVIGTGAKVAGAALAATGAAAVAGAKAFADGVQDVASFGDAIDKNSQRLGISAEKYQQLDYVLSIAGTSMSEMSMGMKTLTNQLDAAQGGSEEAQAKFAALGISMDDLATMSREDIFEATIAGFQNMEESVDRAALANDLLGRSSLSLTPLFNMTNEETKELIATANEYGMVMSDDAVKASAGFQDSLTTLSRTMSGLKNSMLSTFLPSISTVMDGLSAVFAGDDSGLGQIDQGVEDFISNLNQQMPKLIQLGGRIISSLLSAITKNLPSLLREGSHVLSELIQGIILALPSLLESAMIIIESIGNALLENAELLLTTGMDLLLSLMAGITENLPVIIPAITSVIVMIITTLTAPENLDAFIQGALALIMALADGIVIALPQLVSVIPTVIINLVTAIIDNFPMILETVLYLIGALTVAVLDALLSLMGTSLSDVGEGISNIFKSVQDWFKKIGQFFADLANNFLNKIVNFFNAIVAFLENPKQGVENAIAFIKTSISNGIENIKNFLTNAREFATNTITNAKNFVTNTFNNIKTFIPNTLNAIKTSFTNGLNAMKQKVIDIFNNIKQTIQNALNAVKRILSGEISFPKVKLPHFSISGSFSLDPPSIPTISVEWYKKAMNTPYLLNDATIFGAANGKLLGGGESGSEMVIGTNKLMSMMREASLGGRDIVINVYGAAGQDIRQLAKEVGKELQNVLKDKEKVYA
jgi:gas vesicle protein